MLQRLLLITLTLCSLSATAQWQQTGSKVRYVNGLGIPTKDTAAGVAADSSQIVIRPADSALYIKYKRTWLRVGGGGGSIAGGGAAGQVSFFTGASAISGDSALFWDNTNKRLGIHTKNPGRNLDIHGTNIIAQFNGTGTSNAYLDFQNANSTQWRIGNTYNAAQQRFSIFNAAGASEIFTALQNGNVGIGMTNPAAKLDVSGSMNVSTLATTNNLSVTTNATVGGNARVSGTLIAGTTADNNIDILQVYGTSYYTSQMQQRTTSPRFFLDDNDNTGTASLWFRPQNASFSPRGALELFSFGSAAGGELRMSAGAPGGGVTSSHYQTFYTAGVERLRITTGGQFNIGGSFTSTNNTLQVTGNAAIGYTTAAPANGLIVNGNVGVGTANPSTKLTVSGGYANFTDGTVNLYAGSDGSGGLFGTVGNHYQRFITNNAERMRITSDGKALFGSPPVDNGADQLQVNGSILSTQFKLSALNTAPSSAGDTGTLGEIRIDANYIYICTATNTWKRVAIATW